MVFEICELHKNIFVAVFVHLIRVEPDAEDKALLLKFSEKVHRCWRSVCTERKFYLVIRECSKSTYVLPVVQSGLYRYFISIHVVGNLSGCRIEVEERDLMGEEGR